MMVYEKALKLIALLEHPQPDHMDDDDYQVAIEECVAAKFRYHSVILDVVRIQRVQVCDCCPSVRIQSKGRQTQTALGC